MVHLDVRAVHQTSRLSRVVAIDLNFIGIARAYTDGHQTAECQYTSGDKLSHLALSLLSTIDVDIPASCWWLDGTESQTFTQHN
jgi:hypothetical protein